MASWTGWTLLMCAVLTGEVLSVLSDCGKAPLNTVSENTNGTDATAGAWPWQASLHLSLVDGHVCGGTLITNQWILTAAHCCMNNLHISRAWVVYLGRQSQNGANKYEEKRSVSEIIIHPQYNDTTLDNDIALVKLHSPVTFSDHIRPICLASNSSQFYNPASCWVTGWGKDNKSGDRAPPPLQQARVPVVGNAPCSCSYLQANKSITDKMICARPEGKAACQGYSGGPLQCMQHSVWIQAGVAVFGPRCDQPDYPEVYSRVSEFQTWIKDEVAGARVGFKTFASNGTDPDNSFVCPNSSPVAAAHTRVFIAISVAVGLTSI
uniref:Peptidase S1 domain-containing protein n=1 Tax=Takifugu rubripes TaxID=31033 RepID=H2VCD9_TAKRU